MPDEVRIGAEPSPTPPPRGARLVAGVAALVLLAAAGTWLAGVFAGDTTTTTAVPEATLTFTTTTTTSVPAPARPLEERLAAATQFWDTLGRGGPAAGAAAAYPGAVPAAVDLMGFVGAFRPGFTVRDCRAFAANAVQCTVAVTDADLLRIGTGTPEQRLLVSEDGWFDLPAVLSSAASRLSLYALEAHTAEVRAACPVTGNPQVPHLAIVGTATAGCGTYLADLIPEYLVSVDPGGERAS